MSAGLFNPFPGLRAFEADEDHLFFGREKEIDDLLRRLHATRFISVIGTSGSGKSSLVRSGLIPSLHSGFMVAAGSSWRVALMRPGEDPIGHLAAAMAQPDVLGAEGDMADSSRVLIEATLRRGTRGLAEAVRQARLPEPDNVLVVVDQFEELFRFKRSRQAENARDEAVSFVKLLLEAGAQPEVPVYVVLTMRSDFIGDCMEYPGLPEAVNAGQYLVPRMSRDELRSAITGPVAVGGGTIAPRLVLRLLNDLGDDTDQLPLLQHALMRTWDYWEHTRGHEGPIDIIDYEAIGTLKNALSLHAEEAYSETSEGRNRQIAEAAFKALTDTSSDQRGVRRPTTVGELATICGASETEVIEVVEAFRRRGRTFLMPPSTVPLDANAIVDLSHESFMRCWTRLIGWAEEERAAAQFYARLAQAAAWCEQGVAALWRPPELELALRWRRDNLPTRAWAERYGAGFDRTIAFLDRSEAEWTRAEADRERDRKRQLHTARWAAAILGVLLIVAVASALVALRESSRAETNLRLARDAVDQTLASADRDLTRAGADTPEMQEFRQELLERTQRFYVAFMQQKPRSLEARAELALAYLRLGHIARLLGKPDEAVQHYRHTVDQFEQLVAERPAEPTYKQELAGVYNWLGETLRLSAERSDQAKAAYDNALRLQQQLAAAQPGKEEYRHEMARTRYNRGILRSTIARPGESAFTEAEVDFREAIRLLEPLADAGENAAAQELARAVNNLGTLLAQTDETYADARVQYERAVGIHERLVAADADNREYKLELAKFCDNLADLLREQGAFEPARQRNQQALELVDALARPAPSLSIELADVHNVRAVLLQSMKAPGAAREYEESLGLFRKMATDEHLRRLPEFNQRFGDLLLNLVSFSRQDSSDEGRRRLLIDAVTTYVTLVESMLASGQAAEARDALTTLAPLLPELPATERGRLATKVQALDAQLQNRTARP